MNDNELKGLLARISQCKMCESHLPLGPRPVLSASKESKIVVIGQAPGIKVHKSGIPWDDKSGENLRRWMGLNEDDFYNRKKLAIVPMGFCYPGKGKSGDLAPRKECAPLWHEPLLSELSDVKLILLIGQYAQSYYLGKKRKKTLTETVRNFEDYLPQFFVLPHPSPRNNIWMRKNPWFVPEVVPALEEITRRILRVSL